MKVELEPGKYIVAVSGGVDSVSLLHALTNKPELELIVAHFDHGIRLDSEEDRLFVGALAKKYELPFEYEQGNLGHQASEATARKARYSFLNRVKDEYGAQAIITAHHQDDLLETAIINMLRGTGRKGLNSLSERDNMKRPLLNIPKQEILEYAQKNKLAWREDSTNQDEAYLRNYVRRQILSRFDADARQQLLAVVENSGEMNANIDTLLVKYLPATAGDNLDRRQFILLPHAVAKETMAAWLRMHDLRNFDSQTIDRLVVSAKTGRPGSRFDILRSVHMKIAPGSLALLPAER